MEFPFKTLIVLDRDSSVPLYLQISNRLVVLITQGKILPGTFLPSTREMALELDIHRKTVIQAYDEVAAQGWIESLLRKGFRVVLDLPVVKPRSFHPKNNFELSKPMLEELIPIDTATLLVKSENYTHRSIVVDDGFPDIRFSPFEEFLKQYRSILRKGQVGYLRLENDNGGLKHLRQSTAVFLNQTRGLNVNSENVMMTRGAQMAIYISAAQLLKQGDKVIVSDPNYFIADHIFKQLGAELYRVPVDENGMDVSQLETLLKKHKFKLLYVIPHHHHPTTVTMSANRRVELLNLAGKHDLWVIEDDYDYDFHYRNSPILPLASADHHGKVIYIGSHTKLLGSSFRIGYMVADRLFVERAAAHRRLMDLRGDFMMEEALAQMIDSGMLARHIKRSKNIYARRLALAELLLRDSLADSISFTPPQGEWQYGCVSMKRTRLKKLSPGLKTGSYS